MTPTPRDPATPTIMSESSENETAATRRIAAVHAVNLMAQPGVEAVVILISIAGDDQTTKFCRHQLGNIHACEGLIRERIREMEHYEIGYHHERGRYDSVVHRHREQEQQRGKKPESDPSEDWKDLE